MSDVGEIPLQLATLQDICVELAQRPNETHFVLLYVEKETNQWKFLASPKMTIGQVAQACASGAFEAGRFADETIASLEDELNELGGEG